MKLPITVVLFIGSFAFGVAALNTPACTPWSSPQARDDRGHGPSVDLDDRGRRRRGFCDYMLVNLSR